MSEVQWWPSEMMDEVMPTGKEKPEDWLFGGSSIWIVADEGEGGMTAGLKDGQIVNFVTCTDEGSASLTLNDDKTWSVDFPMPASAKQCCIMSGWQSDTLGDTVEQSVKGLIDNDAEPDTYEISYFTWSDNIPLRFDLATRSFVAPGTTQ